jgi:catechol 2,3-dioxygenase-like lactoylglutathione lyase family enzyme
MTVGLVALRFDATDPRGLAAFWATALGWRSEPRATGGKIDLLPPDATVPFRLAFRPAGAAKRGKNRIHLDLTTSSADDQEQTVRHLVDLGARHVDVGQRGDEGHVVLADPEGNELCVIEPENRFLAGCGRLGSITCDGSPAVGRFWSAALGLPLVWDQDDETAVRLAPETGPFLTWGPPRPPADMESRLHLDVAPAGDGGDVRAEVVRLEALGAGAGGDGRPCDPRGVSLLDPDGNRFCVLP